MLLAGTDKRQSLQIKGKYSTVFFNVVNVGKARVSLTGLQMLQTLLVTSVVIFAGRMHSVFAIR